jgi:hypothetical protein
MDTAVNYWAILACGAVSMLIGFVWYGPLFGKQWMAMVGLTQADVEAAQKDPSKMYKSYGIMFVGALVMAFVLSRGIAFGNAYLGSSSTGSALISAFWFWFGFMAPVLLGPVLWEKKPWKFWALNAGYYLVLMLVMATIISIWP